MSAIRKLVVHEHPNAPRAKVKRKSDQNLARLTREEVDRLFAVIGRGQIVHIQFIIREMKIVFDAMGLNFRSEFLRNALLTADSPYAQYRNMIWIETAAPRITFYGRRDTRNRTKRR